MMLNLYTHIFWVSEHFVYIQQCVVLNTYSYFFRKIVHSIQYKSMTDITFKVFIVKTWKNHVYNQYYNAFVLISKPITAIFNYCQHLWDIPTFY